MGVVYKAQDIKLDRPVAIKFLPSHLSSDKTEKQRFLNEVKTASALDHTNIFTIHTADVVIMPAGRDFRFLAEDQPGPDEFDYTFVSFADQFGPIGLCIGPPSHHITVPADFLEVMPPGGEVQYGFLNHQVEEHDGRRIDFIGVNSREARYLIDDEYLQDVSPD